MKKILAVDDDINQVSNHAVFLCTRAAELFLRHLASRAYLADKGKNKTKKSLQYADIANLVHRTDNLEFLSDVVPERRNLKEYQAQKKQKEANLAEKKAKKASLAQGQATLNPTGGISAPVASNHAGEGHSRPGTANAAPTLDAMLNGPVPEPQTNGSKELRIKHYEPKVTNGTTRTDTDGDTAMEG